MPTWPSGTKASTNNVDEGTDLISNARADIKQNFDNVNDIIDTFNISSPSDGDLLQYSSSSGQWEQVAATSVGGAVQYLMPNANITSDSAGENNSVPYDAGWTSYGASLVTIGTLSGYSTLTFPAGTYFIRGKAWRYQGFEFSGATLKMIEYSGDSSGVIEIEDQAYSSNSGTTDHFRSLGFWDFITLTSSTTFYFRLDKSNPFSIPGPTLSIKLLS